MEGQSKQEENNSDYYIGNWWHNQRDGKGKLVKANGEISELKFNQEFKS